MQIIKVLMVAATGMGLTWFAQQLVEGPPSYAQTQPADPAGDAQSASDVNSVLEDAEAAAAAPDELEEFTPSKPLSADQAVSMPSDI